MALLDLTNTIQDFLMKEGFAVNGPDAQLMVYYFMVRVNERVAQSPWERLSSGDVVEIKIPFKGEVVTRIVP